MTEQKTIDWAQVNSKLPYEKTSEAKAQRDQLWQGIDANGNGYLSLAEVDRGVRDVLGLEDSLFDAKPAIMRAFQAAKNAVTQKPASARTKPIRCPAGSIVRAWARNSRAPLAVPAWPARKVAHKSRRRSLNQATTGWCEGRPGFIGWWPFRLPS